MWLVLPLPLIISVRYFMMFWKHWAGFHIFCGLAMVIPTFALVTFTSYASPWKLFPTSYHHGVLGLVFGLVCIFVVAGGYILRWYQIEGQINERALQCWKISHKVVVIE